jgi:ketosteroid isomerase-like protein
MTREEQIREIIERWAEATRAGNKDQEQLNHAPDALIFDALPPLKYDSAADYRQSFDEWWPDTAEDQGLYELQDLQITAGEDVAYAHALVRCGGARPDGSTFEDLVRVTHCLRNTGEGWRVAHSHTSKPIEIDR